MQSLYYSIKSLVYPILFLFIFAFGTSLSAQVDSVDEVKRNVIIIPVSGNVDPALAAYIGRALRDYPSDPNTLLILEMDTFGGRVDAALQIVDTLSSLPVGRTVAFVKNRAISAGALIALACSNLAMKHNTTIGDCAPITYSKEGPQMLGEKFQSPLRARFRALAKRNNYPALLAEAMVTAQMIVMKVTLPDTVIYVDSTGFADLTPAEKRRIVSKKTIVKRGELLTMDDQEAADLGFSFGSVDNIEELLTALHIEDYTMTRIETNWSERFVSFIGTIAPILMMIGFAALYTELKAPGFGLPGIIGIICLALVFGSQYMVGLADYTEMLFIVIGILLLGVELFIIPGFGVIGIAGMAFMAVGMILSLQDFVIPRPELPWQKELLQKNISTILISMFGSVILIVLFFRYLFPRMSKMIPGPYLFATLAESHVTSASSLDISVGERGVVAKILRPSGSAKFGDTVYDVVTDGEFIEKGESVVVTEISGNRIVVIKGTENGE